MEVILLERIEKLGQMGDVVNVKPGYARNYLLPQKKALRATKHNMAHFEGQRSQLEAVNLDKRAEAEKVGEKLDGLAVVIVRQASDSDQLYGSVNTRDIANAVSAEGFTIDRRQIQLDRPIKSVGLHRLRVRLHPEVAVTVTANVARSAEEAELQARGQRPATAGEEDDDAEAAAREAMLEAEAVFEPGAEPEADAAAQPQPEIAADATPEGEGESTTG